MRQGMLTEAQAVRERGGGTGIVGGHRRDFRGQCDPRGERRQHLAAAVGDEGDLSRIAAATTRAQTNGGGHQDNEFSLPTFWLLNIA